MARCNAPPRPSASLPAEIDKADIPRPSTGEVDGAELKARLRKAGGHLHEHDLADAKAGLADVAQTGLGPEVVDRDQKDHVVGHAHGVGEKGADLAPRRIGDDPIDLLLPGEKIAPLADLAPRRARRQGAEKVALSTAGFEDATGGPEMTHQPLGHLGRGLHHVVAAVVSIRLRTHAAGAVATSGKCTVRSLHPGEKHAQAGPPGVVPRGRTAGSIPCGVSRVAGYRSLFAVFSGSRRVGAPNGFGRIDEGERTFLSVG